MSIEELKCCPGTLAKGFSTYSRACLKKVFKGKKVQHILPYNSPASNSETDLLFDNNRKKISISGVQEKYSVLLEKNKLRLIEDGEQGEYILKPIPGIGKKPDQMPANEHLTMQIAKQIFGIETAENAMIFFQNGAPAYITKRFDIKEDGSKLAQEDFASLAEKTPHTHGEHFKYKGNYLELFEILKKYVPAYQIESIKLFKIIVFNYLFSNGDAHLKNFSLIETNMGDFKLSPFYDLLNSRIHIDDNDFALEEGLLPKNLSQGKISQQLQVLAEKAGIHPIFYTEVIESLTSQSEKVKQLVFASFLNDKTQKSYWQFYEARLKRLRKT